MMIQNNVRLLLKAYLQWRILAHFITYINNFITLMIRNYFIAIDETHINFDRWYLIYAGTSKHCMSNATIDI